MALLKASYARAGLDPQNNLGFTQVDFLAPKPEPVLAFVVDRIHPRLRLGAGVSIPLLLGSRWPETVVAANGQQVLGPTRYFVTDANLINVFAHIGGSFRINQYLSVGATANLVLTLLSQKSHIDFANEEPLRTMVGDCTKNPLTGCENATLSTPTEVSGKGFGAGATVGLLFQPWPFMRIGVSYISPVKQTLKSDLTVDTAKLEALLRQFGIPLMPLGLAAGAEASLTVPQQVQAAISAQVHPQLELAAGFQWFDLSEFSLVSVKLTAKTSMLLPDSQAVPVVRRDQFNTFARAIFSLPWRWRFVLRVEYINNTVPETFTTPADVDWDRIDIGIGAEVRLTPRIRIGASYAHIVALTNTVALSSFGLDRAVPFNKPNPVGTYTFSGDRLGVWFDYTF